MIDEDEIQNTEDTNISEEYELKDWEGWGGTDPYHREDNSGVYGTGKLV